MRRALSLRTANNRCPFLPQLLKLPISGNEGLQILLEKGYSKLEINLVETARKCIGRSVYQWNHHPDNAPNFVDCASFVRWLYGRCGIWLPRYAIMQHDFANPVKFEKRLPGDLIFCQGRYGKFWTDQQQKIGHVGMLTGRETVIHAAGGKLGVVETAIERFTEPEDRFRGIGRICKLTQTTILEVRPGRLIETLEDLRWDILNTWGR